MGKTRRPPTRSASRSPHALRPRAGRRRAGRRRRLLPDARAVRRVAGRHLRRQRLDRLRARDLLRLAAVRALFAAYLFGAVTSIGFNLQLLQVPLPLSVLSPLPYLLTLIALVVVANTRLGRNATAPISLGRSLRTRGELTVSDALQEHLRGTVVTPGDAAYEEARKVRNAMYERRRRRSSGVPGFPMCSTPSATPGSATCRSRCAAATTRSMGTARVTRESCSICTPRCAACGSIPSCASPALRAAPTGATSTAPPSSTGWPPPAAG